jgi:hypothetical protein
MNKGIFFIVVFNLIIYPLFGQEYIKVMKSDVEIHSEPSTSSMVVAKTKDGIVFELKNVKELYFVIVMFSGEYRYIEKASCEKVDYDISIPENEKLRKTVYRSFLKAEDLAIRNADKKYPSDFNANIDYLRILTDRHKLKILIENNIQPPVYSKIISEGSAKQWYK